MMMRGRQAWPQHRVPLRVDGIAFGLGLGQELTDEEVGLLGNVDVLFVPVGGVFTIDSEAARRVVSKIRPRVAIPMHYHYGGLSITISSVDPFLEGLPEESILRVGNEIEFTKDELPQQTEYWVFSP